MGGCPLLRQVLHAARHRRHPYGTPPEAEERAALAVYLFSSIAGCVMSVFGKLCAASGLHFFQLTAVRSAALCCMVAPMLLRKRINPFAVNSALPLLLLRSLCGFLSMSLWYLALSLIPLSDANSLAFISPVLVAAAAPYLLGDPTPAAVYCAMPACLAGMLMVAQPTWLFGAAAGPTSGLGVAAGIAQALFSSGSKLAIRALNKHQEPLESILFSMGAMSTLGALAGCAVLPGAQLTAPAGARVWALLAALCAIAFVVQVSFTYAARKCNASTAASLDYLSMLWYLLADALVLGQLPSRLSLAGASLICGASLAALLWTARHPAADRAAAAEGPAAAAAAAAALRPLAYKRRHYGGVEAAHGCGGDSSEGEAVSLIAAAAASGPSFADAVAGKQASVAALAAGGADVGSGWPDRAGPKLASLPGTLTDSSKSWQLGTEVEAALAASATVSGATANCQALGAASTTDAATIELQIELQELQMVVAGAAAPAAARTSSEKEATLRAAGK